ncbi:DUF441 domain-containing protein [Acinetobacter baumannii]|uniref:DUF441 domain-containing protein n=1 Tax=Acinetobacter baumannii TaxID=470 RepID=UPI000F7366AC|nr:DUF441 domain-containing protein [Acinetobacter baumannii]RSQ41636.1 DUF441 domain-containing protein [Acinetobacter baumannii]
MQAVDFNFLILLIVLGLGCISHNMSIIVSSAFLIILKVTPLHLFLPYISKNSLNWGVIILTIGVLAPIATGAVDGQKALKSFLNFRSLIAIIIGILVAWIAGRGVKVMTTEPDVLIALMIGTISGVIFLKGLPVGPLIAAGLFALITMKY